MSTFQERLDKTKELVSDDNVSFTEGAVHIYYWVRFELAILQRNRYATQCQKYAKKLNINLDVFTLRKELSEL